MALLTEYQSVDAASTISALRKLQKTYTGASGTAYGKSIAALASYWHNGPHCGARLSEHLLADWIVEMERTGHTRSTCSYYLNNIAGLYHRCAKAGELPQTEIFTALKSRLKTIGDTPLLGGATWDGYTRIARTAQAAERTDSANLYRDMLAIGLLNRGMAPESIARLKSADIESLCPSSQAIARRHASPRRRYVFALNQGEHTAAQLSRMARQGIAAAMARDNIPQAPLDAYWLYAALTHGMGASEAIAILGHNPELPLSLLYPTTTALPAADDTDGITEDIAATIIDNPHRWFAIKLRPGVQYDTFVNRLDDPAHTIEYDLYYPCQAIARRTGSRLVYQNRPLIADIVFLRTRQTDIAPLIRRAADVAWCYRSEGGTGPYAIVPNTAMHIFQTAVGIFMRGQEVVPAGTYTPTPADRVEILGGAFSGYLGRVEKIISTEGSHPDIVRLILPGGNGIEWRVDIDPRLLRPISD